MIGALAGLAKLFAFGTCNSRPDSTPRSAASIRFSSGRERFASRDAWASLEPDEQLLYELDGAPFAIITVSQYSERLPSGTWSSVESDNPLDG